MSRTFVGFGFGPIQSGLFIYEAFKTGRFDRLVIAEVSAPLVKQVRDAGGIYQINIAHPDRIEQQTIRGVEIYNPAEAGDRERLIEAIAGADEISTALPSVDFFGSGGEASVLSVLAAGIRRAPQKQRIVYAAENNNHAAEILTQQLQTLLEAAELANLQALNTVIGKMSGVITEPEQMKIHGLARLTPSSDRAILVELFNRILISRVTLPGFVRGIDVFVEKQDLLPFEEAKLYGHNAVHALLGYLAHRRGLSVMSEVAGHPELLAIGHKAFINESGVALVRKYGALGDPMFTPEGMKACAEDLLVRMVNPNLQDQVLRVIRDPKRKLAFNDRLFGAMHLALRQGVRPINMARGAAAALEYMLGGRPSSRAAIVAALKPIWHDRISDHLAAEMIDLAWAAMSD